MANFIETYNERELSELEKEIAKEFQTAYTSLSKDVAVYLASKEKETETKRKQYEAEEITETEYKAYLRQILLTGTAFTTILTKYQNSMNEAFQSGLDLTALKTIDIFMNNGNYTAYTIERAIGEFDDIILWNNKTAKELIEKTQGLLPTRKLSTTKNNAWNKKQFQRIITSAVQQGTPIPKISKNLENLMEMNKTAATRNARTAVTSAQGAGRQAMMEQAEAMAIRIVKRWVATEDSRTRKDHRELDGQVVAVSGSFKTSDGIEIKYPGDVKSPPSELWNCRCRMVSDIEGVEGVYKRKRFNSDKYKQWKERL